MCAQIWRTPCLLSTFSTLNFPHYWHLTPNHLQKNRCSTQDMRRKLRKSKHLLHCSCTLFPPGKAVYMPPFTLVAVWLLPRCHLRSINSQSTAVQPCPVTTVWCAASNQSPPPFSPPFIAVHLYTHTQTFTDSRSTDWVTHRPYTHRNLKKSSAASGRAKNHVSQRFQGSSKENTNICNRLLKMALRVKCLFDTISQIKRNEMHLYMNHSWIPHLDLLAALKHPSRTLKIHVQNAQN